MASTLFDLAPATMIYDLGRGAGRQTASRSATVGATFIPDKVKGRVIKFDDGSIFRRATEYAKLETAIQPGPAQYTQGKCQEALWFNNDAYLQSSPGGYNLDDVYSVAKFTALKAYDIDNTTAPPGSISGGMRNEAVTNAMLKLADQKAGLGENLATFLQTIRLVSDPLDTLVKGIRYVGTKPSLRQFLRKSARELRRNGPLSVAAQEYLKYVYGWKPLMQDIHGIMEYAKQVAATPLLLNARYTARRQPVAKPFVYDNVSNTSVTVLGPLEAEDRVSCSIWAQIDPDYAGTRALNQLGLANPLSLAWELVPFSFIVDWVLPVGGVLQALSAPAGLKFVDGSLSRRVKLVGPLSHRNQSLSKSYPRYSLVNDRSGGATFTYNAYRREVIGTWPTPGLWVDYDPLRGDRPLKALALTTIGLKSLR